MAITDFSKKYHEKMFPGYVSGFLTTDPDFIEAFDNFAFDEVINEPNARLGDEDRFLCILAALVGCQGMDEFRGILPAALNFGITPVQVKEIIYQSVAYVGIGRAFPFLKIANEELPRLGYALPNEWRATTNSGDRLEQGNQLEIDTFGEKMRENWKTDSDYAHINRWLAANCFGDYYTRSGLNMRQREMITFCFLAAQGGCEMQLMGHVEGNVHVGNDRSFLIAVISQILPFIGYPRSLNAFAALDRATK